MLSPVSTFARIISVLPEKFQKFLQLGGLQPPSPPRLVRLWFHRWTTQCRFVCSVYTIMHVREDCREEKEIRESNTRRASTKSNMNNRFKLRKYGCLLFIIITNHKMGLQKVEIGSYLPAFCNFHFPSSLLLILTSRMQPKYELIDIAVISWYLLAPILIR